MRMLFTETPAGKFVGVTGITVRRWSEAGLIPFGVRPLQDGQYQTYHRSDLEYARDVVRPTRRGAGIRALSKPMTRRPAGILAGSTRR